MEEAPLLKVNNIEVIYEHVILVLKGVSLDVFQGNIVSLLGANGAGKTTTLKAISNLVKAERGEVTKGTVEFEGKRIDKMFAPDVVKLGVIQIMEGRRTFEHLTVEDDLLTGAYTRGHDFRGIKESLDAVYKYFPRLVDRKTAKTGYISGGEMQMCAIGRALMAKPKLMLLDEPSMGLAPLLVQEIFGIIVKLNKEENVAMLLAEQNANMALNYANYGYIMENGRVVLDGEADVLKDNADVREFYLGLTEVGKKSYRDVKHYKRRKRWLA
ncbi:MAG: ABC transporter ATP-binding protein [Deltaproteobacteria bacterium]|nr:ABC transporter ATP-binding protein [Deltaproteobacteria bacterium]MBW1818719.1 ABC transporter ATP-binding protein [Deltaproteobacteria bacterium]